MRNFRIKVCGITRVEDALMAVETGVDALGFNFSQGSKRGVRPTEAAAMIAQVRQVRPQTVCVGVFVEQTAAEAGSIAVQADLDLIQLHGEHPLSELAGRLTRPVVWVTRLRPGDPRLLAATLARTAEEITTTSLEPLAPAAIWPRVAGLLVDAYSPHDYGGTGQTVSWEPLGQRTHWLRWGWSSIAWPNHLPLILAGGLTPDNVATAILQARPDAIDVASGVETQPGIKSAVKVRALVAAAQTAWLELPAAWPLDQQATDPRRDT